MIIEGHSDNGTVLMRDQAALVWSPQGGFSFLMPDYPSDATVPDEVLALSMLLLKLDDEFVQELAEEMRAESGN